MINEMDNFAHAAVTKYFEYGLSYTGGFYLLHSFTFLALGAGAGQCYKTVG
jgi:hypothetical protein